jgi:hypothetical protein
MAQIESTLADPPCSRIDRFSWVPAKPRPWAERLQARLVDRLGEPLHLNLLAACVALCGDFRTKVAFDLVERRRYAYPMLKAADQALALGLLKIYVLEFGIAAGAGLRNLAWLAERVTKATGVEIGLVGFDSGAGMPPPIDYRDYPEEFIAGDFPMADYEGLLADLPASVKVILGPVETTIPGFVEKLDAPIGFVSLDVVYWSSTVAAMQVLAGPADRYLPMVQLYLGAIHRDNSCPAVGELAAVAAFNAGHPSRPIYPATHLREKRIFKSAMWLNTIYVMHTLDHPTRSGRKRLDRDIWVLP